MTDAKSRHLMAVMFTDVVGYTALMQDDEDAARDQRARHRARRGHCRLGDLGQCERGGAARNRACFRCANGRASLVFRSDPARCGKRCGARLERRRAAC